MARKSLSPALRPRLAVVLAGALMCSAPAIPAENDWYIRATGGFSWQADDDNNDFSDPGGEQNADASFDTGWTGGLALGRWLGSRWRTDLEWAYRSNDSDRIKLDDGRVADDGNYASTTLSVNAYYHFADGRALRRWSPYAGAGLAWVNEIDIDLEGRDFDNTYEDLEDDGFGVQVMGGVSWRQNEHLRWDAELRWLYFGEADLDNGSNVRLEGLDYAPVTLTIGLSYAF